MKAKLTNILRTIFPTTVTEAVVFVFFLIAYSIFGYYIAENYRLIYDERIPWDAYFSFDNRSIVNTGGGWERHPLSIYLFDIIRKVALYFSNGKTDATFRIVLMLFSSTTVSLTFLQLYKYLRNIIKVSLPINIMILLFFSIFTTPILLSFTPETYTYSLFLLVLFNYVAALAIKKNKDIGFVPLTTFGVFIGGLTITNIVKVYIPILYENDLFRSWKKFAKTAVKVIASVAVFVLLYLWRLDFKVQRIFEQTENQYEKFSQPKVTPLWDMIVSWFWGGNILFPSFVIRDYHSKAGFQYKALFMDVYTSWMPYVFVAVVFGLIVWAIIANFKNKLVQIITLSFLVDIVIHCVMKFGLHTSYIYGGHFIFVVPMLIGWLFYSQRDNKKTIAALWVVMILLFVYLGLNNFYRLSEFIDFADKYYR